MISTLHGLSRTEQQAWVATAETGRPILYDQLFKNVQALEERPFIRIAGKMLRAARLTATVARGSLAKRQATEGSVARRRIVRGSSAHSDDLLRGSPYFGAGIGPHKLSEKVEDVERSRCRKGLRALVYGDMVHLDT